MVRDYRQRRNPLTSGTSCADLQEGFQKFHAAELDSAGDHRIAMAFAVASLAADGPCAIEGAEAASVSFPEFYSTLRQIAR